MDYSTLKAIRALWIVESTDPTPYCSRMKLIARIAELEANLRTLHDIYSTTEDGELKDMLYYLRKRITSLLTLWRLEVTTADYCPPELLKSKLFKEKPEEKLARIFGSLYKR